MKKNNFLILILLVILSVSVPCFADNEAAELSFEDFRYVVLEDGTAEITGYDGTEKDLIIASDFNNLKVTSIGVEAFKNNEIITSVKIPESVLFIWDKAFLHCTNLENIEIPDSVVCIGNLAFGDCESLTNITIPDSVLFIGNNNPFIFCDNLTNIKVSPDHPLLATIDGVLFCKSNKSLVFYPSALKYENYTIPKGIQNIGNGAFELCGNLKKVIIPNSVSSIGEEAFAMCYSLSEIIIPDGVTYIGRMAFYDCACLTKITIPDSVTAIGEDAFQKCDNLNEILVGRDSYARQYCIDNNLSYTYPDANDWLLN